MVAIGSYRADTNVFLAPLSGWSDLPFRLVARARGTRFCFFEMLDAASLVKGARRTLAMLKTVPEDRPVAAQLLGRDPEIVREGAARLLALRDVCFLDVNAACPAPKVVKRRAGVELLREPALLGAIVARLAASAPVPVTVKLRTGCGDVGPEAVAELARRCEGEGAAAVFVHGRTAEQGYGGPVDLAAIRLVRAAVRVPVFGSGDILSPGSAVRMVDETGCAGVLAARGAVGDPWMAARIEAVLAGRPEPPGPTVVDTRDAAVEHLELIERFRTEISPGTRLGVMKRIAVSYVRFVREAARLREAMMLAPTAAALIAIARGMPGRPVCGPAGSGGRRTE